MACLMPKVCEALLFMSGCIRDASFQGMQRVTRKSRDHACGSSALFAETDMRREGREKM